MSLLMQALKRAEDAKRKHADGGVEEAGTALSLEEQMPAGVLATSDFPALIATEDMTTETVMPSRPTAPLAPAREEQLAPVAAGFQSPESAVSSPAQAESAMVLALADNEAEAVPALAVTAGESGARLVEPSLAFAPPSRPEPSLEYTGSSATPAPAGQADTKPAPAHAGNTPTHAAPASTDDRNKAKMVFSAKRTAGGRRTLILGGSLALGLALAGAGYYYLQTTLSGIGSGISMVPVTPPPAGSPQPLALPEAATADAAGAAATTTATATAASVAPADPAAGVAAAQAIAANIQGLTPDRPRAVAAEPAKPQAATSPVPQREIIEAVNTNGIEIRKGASAPGINPALQRAYQAFNANDFALAQQEYSAVLQQDAASRDALLGLAAIAVRKGQPADAGPYYGRMLDLDPNDPDAHAGLTSLQQGDPVQSESRLKKILAQHPQAGAVWFALGNLYARQSRWADAQQTYFSAFGSAPANADYAFNLAVSLDQLTQPALATEYYQRALTLARETPAGFSRPAVQQRLQQLQQLQAPRQ